MGRLKLAVLISGGGTNLQAIIDAVAAGIVRADIACVISDRKEAYGLERAQKAGIETRYIGKGNYPERKARQEALCELLETLEPDLIVLAGYLSILPEAVTQRFARRIINVHPSLIPKYCGKGFYGHYVHEAVLEGGESESGATVHFVDQGVDTGEIIVQERVPVLSDDTAETLAARVLKVEHRILVNTLKNFSEGKIELGGFLETASREEGNEV
ncbi:MAG: phosphoribosylglycinamide formyltransferase 1 [Clostridiales bacterium]|jgi:phosphoribosylglycinamide formyltransferase-1|nr:phosphoribosylglycinamide formyltransferase 1 [Clostridiales bacterium]